MTGQGKSSRREFLARAGAVGAGLTGLGALQAVGPFVRTSRAATAVTLEVWYQDWGPLTEVLQTTVAVVEKKESRFKFKLTAIPYEQLQQRMLPSIAAGREADILFGYTSWYVATDVSKLFLPLSEIMTREEAETLIYPSALAEGTVGTDVYFLTWANGMGGSTFTYNVDILEKEGVDPKTVNSSWDAFVSAGKRLVRWEGNDLRRAGIAFSPYMATMWTSGIIQMGGNYYDPKTGKFDLTSSAAFKSLKMIDDLLKVHKVDDIRKEAPSHANMTGYGAPDGFEKGLAAITNFGSWIVSGYEKSSPHFRAGIFRMPWMGDEVKKIELSHSGGWSLSRKLAKDPAKKEAAKLFIQTLFSPDSLLGLADKYGGSIASPAAVRSPEMAKRRWGSIQQQYDTEVWPYAQFERHHIPDWAITVAWPALVKVFKDSEPMERVLKELEDRSNRLEEQALERLKRG